MKLSFEKTLTLFFALLFLGITILASISYKTNNALRDNSKMVIRTHEVLFESAQVLSMIQDVQNASRGYSLTKDSAFIIDLYHSRLRVLTHVKRLKSLTRNNPAQQIRVDSLANIINERITHSLRTVSREDNRSSTANSRLNATYKGENLMDEIRELITTIQNEESDLLVQQNRANLESSKSLNRSFLLLLLTAAIFLIVGFVVLRKHVLYRKKVEKRMRRLNENLEVRVEEKTREIREKDKHHHFVLDTMSEGIQLIDHNWTYVYVNNALAKQGKYPAQELLGNTMMSMYPGIENTDLFKTLQVCMSERIAKRIENEFTYPDGETGFYDLSIQPIPEGLFILSMDISERKKAEVERDLHIQEMEKVLFKISHEMRHPIVQILGLTEVMGYTGISKEEMETFLGFVKESAATLDTYTRDLSGFVTSIKNKRSAGAAL